MLGARSTVRWRWPRNAEWTISRRGSTSAQRVRFLQLVDTGFRSRPCASLVGGHTEMTRGIQIIFKAAVAGLVVTMLLMVLQWVNMRDFRTDFPLAVSVPLWVFAAAFLTITGAVLRQARTPGKTMAGKMWSAAGIGLAIVIAMVWIGFVADQMPCFLGVPNCD